MQSEAIHVSRSPVTLRDALPTDAGDLADLWSEVLRRGDQAVRRADVEGIVLATDGDPAARLVLAEYDGQFAGAVLLRVTTATALNLEPMVQVVAPSVLPRFRRRGVGRALMEAAVGFAEEHAVAYVVTASPASSREANRFMTRLGLGARATLRVGTTSVLRARLSAARPSSPLTHGRTTTGGRHIGQVLAARRSMRAQHNPSAGAL